MYTGVKTSYQEPLYTLTEAQHILNQNKQRNKARKRSKTAYYIKQKLFGVMLLLVGAVTPFLIGDLTASIISVPLGILLLVTDEKIVMFRR